MFESSIIIFPVVVLFLILSEYTLSCCCSPIFSENFRRKTVYLQNAALISTTVNKFCCLAACSSNDWCSGGVYHRDSNICKLYRSYRNSFDGTEIIYVKVSADSGGIASEVCGNPPPSLGIGDLDIIPNSAFKASNEYISPWDAANGRICESCKAWCTDKGYIALPGKEWWQVDLGQPRVIQQIAIQGLDYSFRKYWIDRFVLNYGDDGINWIIYRIDRKTKVFDGNMDATTKVKVALPIQVRARYLRVIVESYKCINDIGVICARFELYGCQLLLN